MSDVEKIEVIFPGDRGFDQMGEPVQTDRGHSVRIKTSSAMRETDMCWMFVNGSTHIDLKAALPPEIEAIIQAYLPKTEIAAGVKGRNTLVVVNESSMGIHMTPDQVKAIRDRMSAWLTLHDYE